MPDTFTLAQTAEAIGLSARQFRKVWRTLAKRRGFPQPFRSPDTNENYAWRAAAVLAWRADPPAYSLKPANDRAPRSTLSGLTPAQYRAERAKFMALTEGRG